MEGGVGHRPRLRPGEGPALAALAAIVVITVVWWGLALWPTSAATPTWVLNVRSVCFGNQADGLPNAGGWLLLAGQPIGMLGFLIIVWGGRVSGGLRALYRIPVARAALLAGCLALVGGAGAASARVVAARAHSAAPAFEPGAEAAVTRLDRPAPPLSLVDQSGRRLDLSGLEGRPVVLTFAFGHCETVCPAVVRQVLQAKESAADLRPAVVVVTLDPWRDTPSRLAHIAAGWGLGSDAHLLSGTVAEVQAALDRWDVPRSRDARTGDVVHPALVYVIDGAGRVSHRVIGPAGIVADLLREL